MAPVRGVPMYQVDAFSAVPFGGNPAAVCLLSRSNLPMSDSLRQSLAAENNLSETAFVEPVDADADGDANSDDDVFKRASRFKLRWFTPAVEVPLCGHATLASAHALFFEVGNASAELAFETASGTLTVTRAEVAAPPCDDDAGSAPPHHLQVLEMRLPLAAPVDALPTALGGGASGAAAPLLAASAVLARLVAAVAPPQQHPATEIGYAAAGGLNYLLVSLGRDAGAAAAIARVEPDCAALLAAATRDDVHGVIVTAAAPAVGEEGLACAGGRGRYDVVSRFFAPWMAIDEDAVTGSAHCVLAPFWAPRLAAGEGATLRARQASARGGDVWMRLEGGRVVVSGQGVVTVRGYALLPLE